MTNGSCQSTCESHIQPQEKPASSARCIIATTPLAGGFVCRTTPKSIFSPERTVVRALHQVLIQPPGEERPVAGVPGVRALFDDRPPAGQGGHHPAGDLHALVRG